jgi:hypothetical protein
MSKITENLDLFAFYGTLGLVLEQARFTSKRVGCLNFFAAFSLVVYYVDERHPDTQL